MSDMRVDPGRSGRLGKSRSLARDLFDSLSQSIRNCVIRPGEKLPTESELIKQFGVSRTVVREAVSSLQAAGLVETLHGIGTFVRSSPNGLEFGTDPELVLTVRDVVAMMELRVSLETEAAGLAASRRNESQLAEMRNALRSFEESIENSGNGAEPDFQFHLQIAYATGNRYFVEVMSHLGTSTIPRSRIRTIQREGGQTPYLQDVNKQHANIYEAILRRDPAAARAGMNAHLSVSYESLRRAVYAVEARSDRPEHESVKASSPIG